MNPWRRAWAVVREFRRAYLVINIAYYGLVVLGMVYVAFNPALQNTLLQTVGAGFSEGPLAPVGAAYGGGNILPAIGLTFVVNLLLGTLLVITVPSLVIPFSGLLVGAYRAALWGLMLSPAHPDLRLPMLPHMLTLIIEGQAYILAMLGAYAQARAFLWPKVVGASGHGRGYLAGLQRTGWLYVLVISCLAVAAVYEALEVILMMRLLG